jgi:DNA-binding phage protein
MSVKARRQHQQAEFDTIQKIVNSLGVKLVAEPIRKSVRSAT